MATKETPFKSSIFQMYPFIHLSKVPNWIGENATKAVDDLQHHVRSLLERKGIISLRTWDGQKVIKTYTHVHF
jgi:hypothetical protein